MGGQDDVRLAVSCRHVNVVEKRALRRNVEEDAACVRAPNKSLYSSEKYHI